MFIFWIFISLGIIAYNIVRQESREMNVKGYASLSDTNIGGAGRWLINVLKHIDREEFDVIVAIPEGSLLKEIEKLNVKIFEILEKAIVHLV